MPSRRLMKENEEKTNEENNGGWFWNIKKQIPKKLNWTGNSDIKRSNCAEKDFTNLFWKQSYLLVSWGKTTQTHFEYEWVRPCSQTLKANSIRIVKQDTPKVLSHSGYCTNPPPPHTLLSLQKIKLYVTLLSDLSPQKRLRSVAALEKQREKNPIKKLWQFEVNRWKKKIPKQNEAKHGADVR